MAPLIERVTFHCMVMSKQNFFPEKKGKRFDITVVNGESILV
jgi:hypothetical protein